MSQSRATHALILLLTITVTGVASEIPAGAPSPTDMVPTSPAATSPFSIAMSPTSAATSPPSPTPLFSPPVEASPPSGMSMMTPGMSPSMIMTPPGMSPSYMTISDSPAPSTPASSGISPICNPDLHLLLIALLVLAYI